MSSLFFSYSHKDEALRDRLEVHLAMLKRQGAISTWHDRRIMAGDNFGQQIDENPSHASETSRRQRYWLHEPARTECLG